MEIQYKDIAVLITVSAANHEHHIAQGTVLLQLGLS